MAGESLTTTDHDEIRRWAEERQATPTVVEETAETDGGILRFNFPGYDAGDNLQEISWDEFFEVFDDRRLALLYQEQTADGEQSNFSKFISRD